MQLPQRLTELARRHDVLYRAGLETRGEARRAVGLEVNEARDNVFYQPLNASTVAADGTETATGNGNGNGSSEMDAEDLARELQRLQPA